MSTKRIGSGGPYLYLPQGQVSAPVEPPPSSPVKSEAWDAPVGHPAPLPDSEEFVRRLASHKAEAGGEAQARYTRIASEMGALPKPYTGATDPKSLANELFARTFDRLGTDHQFVNLAFQMAKTQNGRAELNEQLKGLIEDPQAQAEIRKLETQYPGQGALRYLVDDELGALKKKHAIDSLEKGHIDYATDTGIASFVDGAENAVFGSVDGAIESVKENPLATLGTAAALAVALPAVPFLATGMAVAGVATATYGAGVAGLKLYQAEGKAETNQALSQMGEASVKLAMAGLDLKATQAARAAKAGLAAVETAGKSAVKAEQRLTQVDDLSGALGSNPASSIQVAPSNSAVTQPRPVSAPAPVSVMPPVRPQAFGLKPEVGNVIRSRLNAAKELTQTAPSSLSGPQLQTHLKSLDESDKELQYLISRLTEFKKKAADLDPQSRAAINREIDELWGQADGTRRHLYAATEKARQARPVAAVAAVPAEVLVNPGQQFEALRSQLAPLANKPIGPFPNRDELAAHTSALNQGINRLAAHLRGVQTSENAAMKLADPGERNAALKLVAEARREAQQLADHLSDAQNRVRQADPMAGFHANSALIETVKTSRSTIDGALGAIQEKMPANPRAYLQNLEKKIAELKKITPDAMEKPLLNHSNGTRAQQAVGELGPELNKALGALEDAKAQAQARLTQLDGELAQARKSASQKFQVEQDAAMAATARRQLVATKGAAFRDSADDIFNSLGARISHALQSVEPEAGKARAVKEARAHLSASWNKLKTEIAEPELAGFQNKYHQVSNEILRQEKALGLVPAATPELWVDLQVAQKSPLNLSQARELLRAMPAAAQEHIRNRLNGVSSGRVSFGLSADDLVTAREKGIF